MSESEQDALLNRLETKRRRNGYLVRILIGTALAAVAAFLAAVLLGLG